MKCLKNASVKQLQELSVSLCCSQEFLGRLESSASLKNAIARMLSPAFPKQAISYSSRIASVFLRKTHNSLHFAID
ncbi:MAG: hypothetical protein RMX96_06970 [Nostoc sp. ChiSLP02]|nr:hypothetical protein [Nostoc sp. DedSLP01]MDZ8184575.1 hypothetical protein [Nostoc sp. ChiSLP02]